MDTCSVGSPGLSTVSEQAERDEGDAETSSQTSYVTDVGDEADQAEHGSVFSGYATCAPELSDDEEKGFDEYDSKLHWSELSSDTYSDLETDKENRETFERLRQDSNFKDFFSFTFPDLKVGKKFGEGAQAEIYEGEFTLGTQKKFPCVLKIFNKGMVLSDLQQQWPQGMLKGGNSVFPGYFSGTSSILGGLLLPEPDGRFTIVLRREWGDLRQLIDLRMGIKEQEWWSQEAEDRRRMHKGPVFPDQCAKKMMLEIAMGMRQLHNHRILHRDLKSANVLVCTPYSRQFPEDIEDDAFNVKVFDFESSVGVVGTGFWRAPEMLRASKERNLKWPDVISTKSDVYAYGMTCYEILTGRIPFEGCFRSDWDKVISGERPGLPDGMDEWLRKVIEQCWASDPSLRPEFEDIVKVFEDKFSDSRVSTVDERIAASTAYWTEKGETILKPKQSFTGLLHRGFAVVVKFICCVKGEEIGLERERKETNQEIGLEWERKETNQEIFASLKQDPQYSRFFSFNFHNLELKLKIAQGGQGEIFEAGFDKGNGIRVPCVVKIFDSDFSLLDMVKQWPPGMFKTGDPSNRQRFGFMGLYPGATRTCEVLGAVVFENSDRFAFIFNQEGDLRTLIDLRMKQHKNQSPPFTIMFATKIMHEIALGMQHLHDNDILHRDLKAANVLVTNVFGEFPTEVDSELMDIKVADFECSMLVVGTNFWRAPEILRQLRYRQERTYTRKADVYSYGMTCYEVLTGGVPLEDRGFMRNDYEAVFDRGERPILPDHTDGWLTALIERCWHSQASERPEFKEIIEELESNCPYLGQ